MDALKNIFKMQEEKKHNPGDLPKSKENPLITQTISTRAFTFIDDLPKFGGNVRSGNDINYKPSIDIRTFLRALENHFSQNQITEDAKKLQILWSQTSKEYGDAISLMNCYAGIAVTYEEVKQDFLDMYPSFKRTEFHLAAKAVWESKIDYPSIFCGMTKLENQTRALVEAYLSNEDMAKVKMSLESNFHNADGKEFKISSLLQNFIMHCIMASQLPDKIYEKVRHITHEESSTRLMAKTVRQFEKDRLEKESKKKNSGRDNAEMLYKLQMKSDGDNKCYNCGKGGHFAKECRSKLKCNKCKGVGHEAKNCRKKYPQQDKKMQYLRKTGT